MFKSKTWFCDCITCAEARRLKAMRRKVLVGVVVVFLLVLVAAIAANAQTPAPGVPACFYTPDIIIKVDPAQEPVRVATRTFGAPRSVEAVPYLKAIQGDTQLTTDYERAAVAVQYTIKVNGDTLKGMRLAAFIDNAPDMTIGQVVHNYTWSPSTTLRLNLGYYMHQAVINNPCILEAVWPR